jgi:hypothetical protein
MSRPRDACDRFLPSAASITSTRVSFVLDEVVASRSRTISVSAFATRPVFYADRAFEHPAVSRRRGDCGGWSSSVFLLVPRFHPEATTEPLSCLSSLLDVPACGSLRSGPHTEAAPSSLVDMIREDHAALQSGTTSIERYISSASVLRRLPRATRSRPHVASLSGFRWFCRQRAVPLRRFAVAIPRCVCKRDCLG